jgi:hypothetical protein
VVVVENEKGKMMMPTLPILLKEIVKREVQSVLTSRRIPICPVLLVAKAWFRLYLALPQSFRINRRGERRVLEVP